MTLPTQAEIDAAAQAVIKEYEGEFCDAGGDTNKQCTAPVIKFLQKLGIPVPPMANDRADGWGTKFPAELAPHFTHEAFRVGTKYPEGTVMMFNSPHICFAAAETNGSNTAEVFEQNADPDGSKCHTFNRVLANEYHEATYVLIPKVAAPVADPVYHTVVSGDTMSTIATENKLTLAALEKLNPVTNFESKDYNKIYPGEKVRIK